MSDLTNMTPAEVLDALEAASEQVTRARRRYLALTGWRAKCDTPAGFWLWVKEIDGVTYAVGEKSAITMQRRLSARTMTTDNTND
jgi:hypothetical protein